MALLTCHNGFCTFLIRCLLLLALAIDNWQRRVHRLGRKLRGSLAALRRRYSARVGVPIAYPTKRRAKNRIPEALAVDIVRLHVASPELGAGQLRHIVYRVLGKQLARETIRNILLRNQGLIATLEEEERVVRRRISVHASRELWGIDLTIVWVLGFLPIWILGIIDYYGSHVVAIEPIAWPTAAQVVKATDRAIRTFGPPVRLMSDRGTVFRSSAFEALLAHYGVKHTLTRPSHPWTNGRIERVFRTFKETVGQYFWLVSGRQQWAEICTDFRTFYNDHRPHQAFGGRTPTEVYLGRPARPGNLGPAYFFRGRLRWWRFL